jgi:ATP-dependent Clp protease ATP-binding subunit ClpB
VGEPFDPRFHQGRSLKRAIQKELETSLGKLLLKGEVGDGRTVVVDADAARDYFPVKSGAESQPQTPGRSA